MMESDNSSCKHYKPPSILKYAILSTFWSSAFILTGNISAYYKTMTWATVVLFLQTTVSKALVSSCWQQQEDVTEVLSVWENKGLNEIVTQEIPSLS